MVRPVPVVAASGIGSGTLRIAVAAIALAVAAGTWRHLPAGMAVAGCAALGLVLALPAAADRAVITGHRLSRIAAGNPLRDLLAGPVFRIGLAVVLGTGLASVLLVRLSAGGPGALAVAALAAMAAVLALHGAADAAGRVWTGAHVGVGLRRLAQGAGAAAAVAGALLVGWSGALPDPAVAPPAASALVAELLELHRIWAGAEAWLLGQAVALTLIPGWAAAAVACAGNAAVGWAVARLTVAALMPPAELRRALAAASDATEVPRPSGAGVSAAAAGLALAAGAAFWADTRLARLPPEARPVERLQVAADRIGSDLFRPGTIAAADTLRGSLRDEDASLVAQVRAATDAGFDQVVSNVDPFLDGYYSLWGEYVRLIDLGRGRLEERLTQRLSEALAAGAPFAGLEALQARITALQQRAGTLDDPQGPDAARLVHLNPGEVRVGASVDRLPPMPELRSVGLTTTIEVRAGLGAAAGVIAVVVAQRVVARLAARGTLALAVRAIPLAGVAVGVAADAALVEVEEAMNRDAFRTEIVAAIEAQRAAALALLDETAGSP